MTLVSVVMACFNAEAYLQRSITSIQQQTLSSWELLIVDDASTDGTSAMAQKFASSDPRIKYIRSIVNAGPSASRNIAINQAAGEWIALLDADDAYRPERLERLISAGDAYDLIFDNLVLWDDYAQAETGTLVPLSVKQTSDLTLSDLIESERPSYKWRFGFLKPVVRRVFLKENSLSYDSRLRLAEDFDLYARALLAGGRAKFLDQAFYLYTTQVGQQSGVKSQGTRTVFDYRSRVSLADRLIADHADATRQDIALLRKYRRWQRLYTNALDIAAARKGSNLWMMFRIAVADPRAFIRYLQKSRWCPPLLRSQ